jgi:hypothetical protein
MRLIAFIAAVSLFAGPAFSQNLTAALPKALAEKILEFGYKAELEERVGSDPIITSASEGSSFVLSFSGCTDGKNCEYIIFGSAVSFERKQYVAARKIIDKWNSENLTTAYIDDETAYLNFPVLMNHEGLGPKIFQSNFETWVEELSAFNGEFRLATKQK